MGRRRPDDAGVPAQRLSVDDGEADRSVGVRVVRGGGRRRSRASTCSRSASATTTTGSRATTTTVIRVFAHVRDADPVDRRGVRRDEHDVRRGRLPDARNRHAARARLLARRASSTAFLAESVALALVGGVIGCLLALPVHGLSTGTTNMTSFSEAGVQVPDHAGAARRRSHLFRGDGSGRRPAPRDSRGPYSCRPRACERFDSCFQTSFRSPSSGSFRRRRCSSSPCRSAGRYVALWAVSHFLRAIGLTLLFHRYLAHRAFKMNRVARFVWAFIGTAAMQKGPLWWAGHHVNHHKFADRDGDPHSPMVSGFYYAHIGWFLQRHQVRSARGDQPGHPRLLEVPGDRAGSSATSSCRRSLLAVAMYLARRLAVARLGLLPADDDAGARDVRDQHRQPHVRIAPVRDASTSRATTSLTAFFAVGEGWHNNHHRYQRAARNGFYWWEFDLDLVRHPRDGGGRPRVGRAARAGADLRRGARRQGDRAPRRRVPSIVDEAAADRRCELADETRVEGARCLTVRAIRSDVRDERQMIRRDQRQPRPRQLDADDLHLAGVVDVIEVQDREQTRVGPRVRLQVDSADRRCSASRSAASSPARASTR